MSRAADRAARQQRKYNVSPEQYQRMLDACGNHCPGCGKRFNESTRLPCIDHDHVSGLVRGLLCFYCNHEIGTHHDNAVWFRNIADYLDCPPAAAERIYVPGSPGALGVLT